jgi:tol-pal system protein YbgF
MYDRIKMLESTQEDSERAREQLEQENRSLEERVNLLHQDLVSLSRGQEGLSSTAMVEESAEEIVMESVPYEDEIAQDPAREVKMTSKGSSASAEDNKARTGSKTRPTPAEAAYGKALNLLQNGKPAVAGKLFHAFIKDYPKDPLVPNAHYWFGESHFDQDEFAEAILAFKKVPEFFPNHHKSPDALFKIVSCYVKFNDRQNATFYLGILLKGYPDSQAAKLARKQYADLL